MDFHAEIRRPDKTGIEGILLGMDAQQVEIARKVEVSEAGYDYGPLLDKLKQYMDAAGPNYNEKIYNTIVRPITDILTPEQINTFLQLSRELENHPNYQLTNSFIIKLVENSYEAGNNKFHLDITDVPEINCLVSGIKGIKERPIRIHITGKTGKCCGARAEYATIIMQEAGDLCGFRAAHSTFIADRAGNRLGDTAEDSIFIAQKTGDECGAGASNSTFKTADPATLQEMLKYVSLGNKVVHVTPTGEKTVRNYQDLPRWIEPSRIQIVSGGYDYQPLLSKLEACNETKGHSFKRSHKAIIEPMTEILTPEQINTLLQASIPLAAHPAYAEQAGFFITKLIQLSYDRGHDKFFLHTTALPAIDNIGKGLRGTEERPITIDITGNAGNGCGYEAEHLILNAGETGTSLGSGAQHSIFNVKKTSWMSCQSSKHSTFTISHAGKSCGVSAEYSTFYLQSAEGLAGTCAKNSTFVTPDEKTLHELLRCADNSNIIIFIRPDGTEEAHRGHNER